MFAQEDKGVIRLDNVNKVFRIYDKTSDRLRESLFRRSSHRDFYALKDIDLCIQKGQCVGIVGENGSGKSTLLKVITGILTPSSGSVAVDGRISALLELGAGFNGEYTGMENIYLNGTVLGYSRAEIDNIADDILAFADIGDFIWQPVKTYSSGMFVRLAFAVAIHVNPDILIVDEALAVGDLYFQSKCYRKFNDFKEAGKTILFVSHSLDSILKYCDSAVLLHRGQKISQGKASEVIDLYKQILTRSIPENDLSQRRSNFSHNDRAQDRNNVAHNDPAPDRNSISHNDPAQRRNTVSYDDPAQHRNSISHNDPAQHRNNVAHNDPAQDRNSISHDDPAQHRNNVSYNDRSQQRSNATHAGSDADMADIIEEKTASTGKTVLSSKESSFEQNTLSNTEITADCETQNSAFLKKNNITRTSMPMTMRSIGSCEDSWQSGLYINPDYLEYGDKAAEIIDFGLFSDDGRLTQVLTLGDEFEIKYKIKLRQAIQELIFAFTIKDLMRIEISGTNTLFEGVTVQQEPGIYAVSFRQRCQLAAGKYLLSIGITSQQGLVVHHRLYDLISFEVISAKKCSGVLDPQSSIQIAKLLI